MRTVLNKEPLNSLCNGLIVEKLSLPRRELSALMERIFITNELRYSTSDSAIKSSESSSITNTSLRSTKILIYRDPTHFQARFFLLNDSALALINDETQVKTYRAIIDTLPAKIDTLKTSDKSAVHTQALAFYRDCLTKGILLGSVKAG
jgi:hypothetical protein